jgi:hypothetical protein
MAVRCRTTAVHDLPGTAPNRRRPPPPGPPGTIGLLGVFLGTGHAYDKMREASEH